MKHKLHVRRANSGKRHYEWKEKGASYGCIHAHMRKTIIKECCLHCKTVKDLELATVHGKDGSRNPDDYLVLCRKCHRKYDHPGWSRAHPACVHCHQTSTPHASNGYCQRCYYIVFKGGGNGKSKGEDHYCVKLNNNKVRLIREILSDGGSDSYCSKMFGVSRGTIYYIRSNRTWKEIQ